MLAIDQWSVDELSQQLSGSMDRTTIVKALATWIDLGVLKDEGSDSYRLLNTAEEGSRSAARPGMAAKPSMINLYHFNQSSSNGRRRRTTSFVRKRTRSSSDASLLEGISLFFTSSPFTRY